MQKNSNVPPRQKHKNGTEPTKIFEDPEISDVVDYEFGNLPVEAQVIASEQISNSQFTPIDLAEYTQVMPFENGSILTV